MLIGAAQEYVLAEKTINPNDLEDLIGWLRTNPWLTQGPLVREFESQWGDWVGVRHATFVNSGSSANLLMYYALLLSGRLRNTKVVVPAISWATSVAPAIQFGFEPIMCEADWHTFGLDPTHLEELLKKHDPAAVLIVHVLGVPNTLSPCWRSRIATSSRCWRTPAPPRDRPTVAERLAHSAR
jgi:CDP-6-deoxy-D-xylo-4-hexulose-3-dehydrase